jgi:putative IMPACT (imprinted ancient) family translation regulator
MGTYRDHRQHAEECVAMARASDDEKDKALWLTLAQSWVRLAEHVANGTKAERAALTDDALVIQTSD